MHLIAEGEDRGAVTSVLGAVAALGRGPAVRVAGALDGRLAGVAAAAGIDQAAAGQAWAFHVLASL